MGKVEFLYYVVATPNLVFLKSMLFKYKMDNLKFMDDNLDEFIKMNLLLMGTHQALGETNEVMILLNF